MSSSRSGSRSRSRSRRNLVRAPVNDDDTFRIANRGLGIGSFAVAIQRKEKASFVQNFAIRFWYSPGQTLSLLCLNAGRRTLCGRPSGGLVH